MQLCVGHMVYVYERVAVAIVAVTAAVWDTDAVCQAPVLTDTSQRVDRVRLLVAGRTKSR